MSDISNGTWNTTDASNNSAPPGGWPAGMFPNQVEPSARAMMGATKRWWERANAGITTTGSAGAYVLTPTNISYPTAYTQGEIYAAKANFTAVGADTLNINGVGAKPIYVPGAAGPTPISAGGIVIGQQFAVAYDAALNSSAGGFQLLSGQPVAAGGVVRLASGAISNGATTLLQQDFSAWTSYTRFVVYFDGLPFSGTPDIKATFSANAGVSFLSTGYKWAAQNFTGSATVQGGQNVSDSSIDIAGVSLGDFSPVTIEVSGLNSTVPCILRSEVMVTSNPNYLIGVGTHATTSINALKFVLSTGTINATGGTYRIYGYP